MSAEGKKLVTKKGKKVTFTTDEDVDLEPPDDNFSDNEGDVESDGDDVCASNAGWVDSIAKILKTNKPKGKKTLVLSKAKKLSDVKRDKPQLAGFEVATTEGEIQEATVEPKSELDKHETDAPPRKKKRDLPDLRVKPSILEKDRERTLAKIATKGVVHLFNAVRTQQKDINEKLKQAGPLDVRQEKVLKNIDKRAFLDVLMGEKSQNVNQTVTDTKKEKETTGTWNVLRDDFMMSAKMNDWDKELEEDEEEEQEINMESD